MSHVVSKFKFSFLEIWLSLQMTSFAQNVCQAVNSYNICKNASNNNNNKKKNYNIYIWQAIFQIYFQNGSSPP